ncbi:MAG: hypothetical protein KIT10_14035 [Flavobacteriales bacterium]|nr:hypothetical protein [Flavobacteriales bacterium]
MTRITASGLLLIAGLAAPTMSQGQSATCAGATLIGCGASVSGSTIGFPAQNGPACGTAANSVGPGVWFRFVGTGVNTVASLCGSGFDTQIRVFSGACTGLTCVAGNDDFCGLQSQVTWFAANGVTYWILVHGFGAAQGNYTLNLTCAGPPPNDVCGAAIIMTCGSSVTGNTSFAGADVAPFCGTGDGTGGGVWYRITGTGTNITASLCGSGYDTRIRVYTGVCTALTCVNGNDDFCGLQSEVTWLGVNGVTYYILVHGWAASQGPFILNITCPPPPQPMCYDYTTIPFLAEPHAGTQLFLSDDIHSTVIPIGFSFCYNGANYTQCLISSNNYITFNTANASTYSSWVTQAIPTNNPIYVTNAIHSPWQDIHPGIGGNIRYQTVGTAPNRRFIASYFNVPMYDCPSQLYTSQTILYEGSNCIATMIGSKPICTQWNNGHAVHGLNNGSGTGATVIPGRNNTQWTAFAEGRVFAPTCAPCSTATTMDCLGLILPVELAYFTGHASGPANVLLWATASEENTHYFSVERSADGENFTGMQMVDAAGHSMETRHYRFDDQMPLAGTSYYRLRIVDHDGSMKLTDIVAIDRIGGGGVVVWPNPALDGTVYAALPQHLPLPADLLVRDLAGRLVRTLRVTSHAGPVAIEGLASGSYLLEAPALGPGSSRIFMVE